MTHIYIRSLSLLTLVLLLATLSARAAEEAETVIVELPRLGPWANAYADHPYFGRFVERCRATVQADGDDRSLVFEAVPKRSTDLPLSVGADWDGSAPLDQLSLEAENRGDRAVAVGVILVSQDDRRITTPFLDLGSGERAVLDYSMLDAKPGQTPGQNLAIRRFEVALQGLRAAVEYRVALGKLTFCRQPPVEPIELAPVAITAPAGSSARLAWSPAKGSLGGGDVEVTLTVERGGHVFLEAPTRLAESEGEVTLEPVELPLPRGMPGGSYDVLADTRQAPIRGQARRRASVGSVRVQEAPPGRPFHVRVDPHRGAPTIFLDDHPYHGLMYMTYHLAERYVRPMAEAGVEMVSFDTACGFHPYNLCATTWPEAGVVDFTECDALATRVLAAHPDATLLIRTYVACPPWWAEANPAECMVGITAQGERVEYEEKPGFRPGSWASRKWRRDLGEILRRFVAHLRAASYGDRVVGLMICAGVTEEWMMFGSNTGGVLTDYSEPAQDAFRAWVRKRYGSEDRLRAAWADPQATFQRVQPPTPQEVAAPGRGDFLELPRQARVADWWCFLSDLTADTIEHFARIVKAASEGDWLCGTFYGYVVQFHEPRIVTAGHLAIDRLVRSPDLDFFFSPALYSHRSLKPGGYSTFMSLTETYHLHDKLWLNENDLRTFRVLDVPNVKVEQIDRRQTPEETIALLRRQLAGVLAHGCGQSYFDMGGGWYDDPRLDEEIRAEVAVAERAVGMDRSSASEVAVVIDPEAFTGQAIFTSVNTWLVLGQVASLGNMGAPFDLVTLGDMELLPRRKLWVFLNLFAPTDEEIERIHDRLRVDGATGVFVYAAGLLNKNDGMRRLTGMNVVAEWERRKVNVVVSKEAVDGGAEVTYGTSSAVGPASYGEGEISPTFYVEDEGAAVLGVDAVTGRPGLCLKRQDGWTSVYSAAPSLSAPVLRALARRAGVHLYVDEDAVVYANRSLLGVTVVEAGERVVRLPCPATVEDAFTGKVVGREATRLNVHFDERESKLFFLVR